MIILHHNILHKLFRRKETSMAKTKLTKNGGKKMLTVANPIYDCVFKYLMEDERIAKTLLTALLKKEVVSLENHYYKYSNRISMFHLDFIVSIKEAWEHEKKIHIQLHKNWASTEALKSRQHTAYQYNRDENIAKKEETKEQEDIPIVSIYILGHPIGNIKSPIVYTNQETTDYEGKAVENGDIDLFINSLTHNSIIVSLPLLCGKTNNRLETLLSLFDPIHLDPSNRQIINIDETMYKNDDDIQYILYQLCRATLNPEIREQMNEEDYFISILEKRDTEIMRLNKIIEEKGIK